MTQLEQTFDAVDASNPTIAAYVAANQDDWTDDQGILSTVKAAYYAQGLRAIWSSLTPADKKQFFVAIESAIALKPAEPVTSETIDDPSTVWCTGFLEVLSNYMDDGSLPGKEVLQYVGSESFSYLNAWNERHGLQPYA